MAYGVQRWSIGYFCRKASNIALAARRAARPPLSRPAPARRSPSGGGATDRRSLFILQQLLEDLVERLHLEFLLRRQLGDLLGLLVLQAPGHVDDADVGAHHQVVEAIGDLREHGLRQPSPERLRFTPHRAQ